MKPRLMHVILFTQSGLGIAFDIGLFVVPVVFSWRTLSSTVMRVRVIIIFSFGTFRD